jgi:hypothetical protein
MDIDISRAVIELDAQNILALRDGQGGSVLCLEGTVWITQENDPVDVVLEPGEALELTRKGRAVVQAMANSRIAVLGHPAA